MSAKAGRAIHWSFFGESITLDWLAPTSVAFFMGAESRELFSERDIGESFLDAAIDAGSNIFAPVLEMTALSGAKDLLDTFVYSYNKDGADAGQIVQEFGSISQI